MAGASQHGTQGRTKMDEEEARFLGATQGFLEWFLQCHVYPEESENEQREEECQLVKELVSRIMSYVHKSNVHLFTGETILVGSQIQDLHIRTKSSSSDYDFLAPIHYSMDLILMGSLYSKLYTPKGLLPGCGFSETSVPVYRWGNKVVVDYNKLIMKDILERRDQTLDLTEEDIKNINDQQLQLWKTGVSPYNVMKELNDCVKQALDEERRNPAARIGNIKLENSVSLTPVSPAVQLSLEVDGRAVSVDLVPTIRKKVDMSMDWPLEDLSWLSDWWDQEQGAEWRKPTWNTEEIYKTGTDLVAKNSYWRLTFSLAETKLLKDVDQDGGHRRDALRLLKKINIEKWVPRYSKVLTSYHLKMVLFWASHFSPELKSWATVLAALETLLKVLEFSLQRRHLPSYFLPSLNFFNWHRTEEEVSLKNLVLEALRLEVRLMRCSPQQYLQLNYDVAKPQRQGPFSQRAQKLKEFRRQHQEDFERLKNLKISVDTSIFMEL